MSVPKYEQSSITYPLELDAFQMGWLYSRLTDLRDSMNRDYKNRNPQRPVLDSIIDEVNNTLVKIYQESK